MHQHRGIHLSTKSTPQKQARIQLRKLRELGLYKGDLRKKPSKYAIGKLKQFDDVLHGKATVVTPRNSKRFKGIFETVGDKVIVPRRKGERISIDKKSGEIVSIRKSGKRIIRSRGKTVKRDEEIARPEKHRVVQYVIPFHGRGGETNWFRFPDYDELKKFMAGYDYKGWKDYVIEEDIDNPIDDEELNERIDRKRKGRPIKGGMMGKRRKKRGRK